MAKIDTARIEGYNAMSAEEKLAALEAFEFDDGSTELERFKSALSKVNAENAEWKKKYNEKLSDDERKKAEEAEQLKRFSEMEEKIKQLESEKTAATYKASYTAMGYSEELAADTAKALAEGDMAKVLANQKKHQEELEKKILSDKMKDFPPPPPGNDTDPMNKEKFLKLSTEEQNKYIAENPDWATKLK